MKKLVFICGHSYSGSNVLYEAMNQNPRIQGFRKGEYNIYDTKLSLLRYTEQKHKLNNRSAIYMDELIYNQQLQTKDAYEICKFIYVIRHPLNTLSLMISNNKTKPAFAFRYYSFRMRRLCEMAKRTPGAVLLTYDNIKNGKGIDLITDYLNLREPLNFEPDIFFSYEKTFSTDLLGLNLRLQAENIYEQYLYFLKNQFLLRPL